MYPHHHVPIRDLSASAPGLLFFFTLFVLFVTLPTQDVDEFLLVFLDRLETQLSSLPQKRLLQHVFG